MRRFHTVSAHCAVVGVFSGAFSGSSVGGGDVVCMFVTIMVPLEVMVIELTIAVAASAAGVTFVMIPSVAVMVAVALIVCL